MLLFDDDAELSDYPVEYKNVEYELNKNSAWKTVAIYVAKEFDRLGNPWLRELEQAANCSKSPGDLLLINLRRLELCKVKILCDIFRACDLFEALYIVYGPEPMEVEESLYCSTNGKTSNQAAFGETFLLKCEATGLPPPRYQWFHGNVELAGETSSTLSLLITSADQEGEYQCRVSQYNPDGAVVSEVYSRSAPLTIKPTAVEIIKQPVSVAVKLGEKLILSCKAQAHPVPDYQWYKDDEKLRKHNSDTLRIKVFKRKHKGRYHCVVSNPVSSVESDKSVVKEDYLRQTASVKIALLIANNKYNCSEYTPVPKAEKDAIALGRLLKSMNFEVRYLRNLTLYAMRTEIENFCKMLDKGAYGLFYFGGHGFQYHDRFMMPIDAPGPDINGCADNFSENELIYHIQPNEPAAFAIIEDMCLWEPTEEEMPELYKTSPRVWPVEKKTDIIFAHSTCPGSFSYDSINGKNGVYMSHVLKHIASDKPIEEVFVEIAKSLRESANDITKNQKPMITCCPKTPYRHLTDAISSKGIPAALKSALGQFTKFKSITTTCYFRNVQLRGRITIPNVKIASRVTVQPLMEPFLNDILLTVSDLNDWEIEFTSPPEEQIELKSMNLGHCHILNNRRRVAPDQTQGIVYMKITKDRGTEREASATEKFQYIDYVPQILKDIWLAKINNQIQF